jgi:DNA primase
MAAIDLVLERLPNAKKKGAGRWMCCCPAHEDRAPSLAISEGKDGNALVHCFAGCDVQSVLDAIGLGLSDLFPENTRRISPDKKAFSAQQRLDAIERSARIIHIAACMLQRGELLGEKDSETFYDAIERIEQAVNYAKY